MNIEMIFKNMIPLHCGMAFLVSACASSADDWPQWLGTGRDSVWRETGIVDKFPEGGMKSKWTTPIGSGYSGPAVSKGMVVVMDRIASEDDGAPIEQEKPPLNGNFVRRRLPGKERVLGIRESDGKVIWKYDYEADYTSAQAYAIGPRATPTIDGERVYTFGAEGMMTCLNVRAGDVIWKRDLKSEYNLKIPIWGLACSPLVDGDRLICIVGGKETTCIALDKLTGKELWRSLTAPEPGYSSPVIYDFGGQPVLIIWDSHHIHGLDPKTGKEFWKIPFESRFAMSIAVPRRQGNFLFAMCFDRRCLAIKVTDNGQSAEIAWQGKSRTGVGGVHNTPFLIDDHIYGCGHAGLYTCARLEDGKQLWTTFQPSYPEAEVKKRGDRLRPIGWGNVFTIRHKDRFFLANDHGELIIAKMSPKGYEEVDRVKLIEPTHRVSGRTLVWSHPAFANRCIYLRNDNEIRCYSLAKQP